MVPSVHIIYTETVDVTVTACAGLLMIHALSSAGNDQDYGWGREGNDTKIRLAPRHHLHAALLTFIFLSLSSLCGCSPSDPAVQAF